MKVIKAGRPQKDWAKEYTCTGKGNGGGGCGAVLLVESADLFLTYSYDYGGGHDVYVTFECGACGRLNDIQGYPNKESLKDRQEWLKQKKTEPKQRLDSIDEACKKHIKCHCLCHASSQYGGLAQHCMPCCTTCHKCHETNIIR